MFRINEVVSLDENSYRILIIEKENIVWIDLDDPRALPAFISENELIKAIHEERLKRIADPYEKTSFLMPLEGSIEHEKREKNYEIIKKIITEEKFYDPKTRSRLVNLITEEKVSESNIDSYQVLMFNTMK